MNTRRNEAWRLEEEITNVRVHPRVNEVPSLEKDVSDEQAPFNFPPLTDGDIRVVFH